MIMTRPSPDPSNNNICRRTSNIDQSIHHSGMTPSLQDTLTIYCFNADPVFDVSPDLNQYCRVVSGNGHCDIAIGRLSFHVFCII